MGAQRSSKAIMEQRGVDLGDVGLGDISPQPRSWCYIKNKIFTWYLHSSSRSCTPSSRSCLFDRLPCSRPSPAEKFVFMMSRNILASLIIQEKGPCPVRYQYWRFELLTKLVKQGFPKNIFTDVFSPKKWGIG